MSFMARMTMFQSWNVAALLAYRIGINSVVYGMTH